MAAALVRCQRVNLIHDHCPGGREQASTGVRSQQDIQRFWCRDYDVGRPATHALPLSRGSIAGPHPCANIDLAEALLPQRRTNVRERRVEIFPDIVREGLKRRDVHNLGLVWERSVKSSPNE